MNVARAEKLLGFLLVEGLLLDHIKDECVWVAKNGTDAPYVQVNYDSHRVSIHTGEDFLDTLNPKYNIKRFVNELCKSSTSRN